MKFTLNQNPVTYNGNPLKRVLDLLREDFGLTGTKEGCGIGECGACTIIYNGMAINSCLMFAGQLEGSEVITVEGLSANGELHKLQQSFLNSGAIQCGFCTPGMLMSAYALLLKNPNPTVGEIREAIAGNLCRCTGYKQIEQAISESRRPVLKH